jgi:hypothetical protein
MLTRIRGFVRRGAMIASRIGDRGRHIAAAARAARAAAAARPHQ